MSMTVLRKHFVAIEEVSDFEIGDQIEIGKYTATCQTVTEKGAIFLLDQYLDKPYRMNPNWSNEGGYEACELRKKLQEDLAIDPNFDAIRGLLRPFENGDLFRIPTVGELFGEDDYYEMDDAEQWPLMKDRRNRTASREGEEYEWGWLQNKVKNSATDFACVFYGGHASNLGASTSGGVRPVILLVAE